MPDTSTVHSASRSISLKASAYIVFVCLLLAGLDAWRSWNSYTTQLREMETAGSNLARAIAQQADDTIRQVDTMQAGIVERVEHDGATPAALERLGGILHRIARQLPQLDGMSVFDAHGQRLASSHEQRLSLPRIDDREYFIFHRDHPDTGARIGAPMQSRESGKWVIPVTRRVNAADGAFAGVVVSSIDIQFFRRFYDTLEIGNDGAIALVLTSGTMLLRRPFHERHIGGDMTGTELYRAYRERGPAGSLFIKSPKDGVVRLNSYRQLEGYPVLAAAALSKEEMLVAWREDTLLHTAGVALLVLLAGFLGWRLVQQIRLRSHAEAELIAARDELMRANRQLEKLAMYDPLTGLANRRMFDEALVTELRRARRSGKQLALVMLDVDCFKQYNDSYGHAAGDECLRMISHAIKATVTRRSADLAARYGGEEIVVLLPETNLAGAMAVAERIRRVVRDLDIPHQGNDAGIVTISAGVAALDPVRDFHRPEDLLLPADKALYVAKEEGRDRVSGPPEDHSPRSESVAVNRL